MRADWFVNVGNVEFGLVCLPWLESMFVRCSCRCMTSTASVWRFSSLARRAFCVFSTSLFFLAPSAVCLSLLISMSLISSRNFFHSPKPGVMSSFMTTGKFSCTWYTSPVIVLCCGTVGVPRWLLLLWLSVFRLRRLTVVTLGFCVGSQVLSSQRL